MLPACDAGHDGEFTILLLDNLDDPTCSGHTVQLPLLPEPCKNHLSRVVPGVITAATYSLEGFWVGLGPFLLCSMKSLGSVFLGSNAIQTVLHENPSTIPSKKTFCRPPVSGSFPVLANNSHGETSMFVTPAASA